MKIVQNALFRSCGARFGQIAFLNVKVLKMVKLAWNSLQNGKTVRFSWKLYKTLFSCHAKHVLAKSHFWASKFLKSWNWPQILFKTGKQCAFYENCTKRYFKVMRSTFWPNHIFERHSSQNRETRLKYSSTENQCAFHENCTKRSFQAMRSTFWPNTQFWPSESSKSSHWPEILLKRKNSALFIKILQNALFRSVAARFGQIAFLSVKVLKIVKLAANSFQNWKTARFSWKLYKTLFQVTRGTFWPNRILERQSSQNRETRLKFSSRRKNSALFMKIV